MKKKKETLLQLLRKIKNRYKNSEKTKTEVNIDIYPIDMDPMLLELIQDFDFSKNSMLHIVGDPEFVLNEVLHTARDFLQDCIIDPEDGLSYEHTSHWKGNVHCHIFYIQCVIENEDMLQPCGEFFNIPTLFGWDIENSCSLPHIEREPYGYDLQEEKRQADEWFSKHPPEET